MVTRIRRAALAALELGLAALAACSSHPAEPAARSGRPIAIADSHGLLLSVAADGTMTDATGARVASFDPAASVISVTTGQPQRIALAGAVVVSGDRITIDAPGFGSGALAFEIRAAGELWLNGERWGEVHGLGDAPADRWRLAAGLVVVPMLPAPPRPRRME